MKIPKLIIRLAILLFSLTMMPLGFAESEIRAAFVNVAKVLEDAPQAIEANKRLGIEFEPRNQKLLEQRKELRTLEDRLAKEGVSMSDAQLRKLERDIRDGKREIKRAQEDYKEDLNLRRNEELRKLQKRVYSAIVSLAEAEKFDMILGDAVIYAAKSVDITDRVIKVLEDEFKASTSSKAAP